MFLLGRIRNAVEKDTITEEPISPEARLTIWAFIAIGNSHLKHLYLVFMKHEKHISSTLCDVSNDFRLFTTHTRQGEKSVWQMGESVFLWHLRSPLNIERRLLKCRTTVALSHLASRTGLMLESK